MFTNTASAFCQWPLRCCRRISALYSATSGNQPRCDTACCAALADCCPTLACSMEGTHCARTRQTLSSPSQHRQQAQHLEASVVACKTLGTAALPASSAGYRVGLGHQHARRCADCLATLSTKPSAGRRTLPQVNATLSVS
eukprot:TRINITY_DN71404_c0_g1_i1.p1 TRINITY_DN71404_c0_g1~~TRINITY_DN71404_c0_g1_i1.p1  ORF type:complete len:141 (-),score=9.90 TRINITY_DN71404_c0_g1_i1:107-529(-)